MSHTQTNAQNIPGNETAPALVLSSNPDRAIQEMMDSIDALRLVYVRETEVLLDSDAGAFLSLQDEKFHAARRYQEGIGQILSRKEEMKSADPALKQKLEEMQKSFAALAVKNTEALVRMDRCIGRMGNRIRKAAQDAAREKHVVSYGETGRLRDIEGKSVSTGVSETA